MHLEKLVAAKIQVECLINVPAIVTLTLVTNMFCDAEIAIHLKDRFFLHSSIMVFSLLLHAQDIA